MQKKVSKKSMKSPTLLNFPSKTSTTHYASNDIISSKVAQEQTSLQENTPSKSRLLSNSTSGSETSSNSCHSPSSNVFSVSQSLSSSHPDSHFNLKELSLLCEQSTSSSNIRKSSQDASGNLSQHLNPAPPRRRDCKKFRRSDFPMNTADFQYTIIKLVTKVIDISQQNISQQPTAHVVNELVKGG
ncbi:uncharacterized protein LOC136079708 isoform X2 [Hydra vulgaris]|uniref:Uncharacterized protein LOC136079708 isoform X2 n=1 Tax=Hydra vulgaris TaxID=6087 RepID=A0ABM4BS69_HYDVU